MKYRNLIVSAVVLACVMFVGYYLYDYYKIPDSPEGDRITEIVYPGVDGNPIALSSLKGNVVLVDFWAAWCGPCRYENPKLVALYQKFHTTKFKSEKGFDIYSISLDVKRENWMYAIEQDGLLWKHHVSDLRGWQSDAVTRFGVRSIPANILIDGEGKILGRNLTASEIQNILIKRKS